MTTAFTLLDSSRVRYVTGAMMYFAQGIPQGLLGIAIPTWLVSLVLRISGPTLPSLLLWMSSLLLTPV